jgi:hypothetical protein
MVRLSSVKSATLGITFWTELSAFRGKYLIATFMKTTPMSSVSSATLNMSFTEMLKEKLFV